MPYQANDTHLAELFGADMFPKQRDVPQITWTKSIFDMPHTQARQRRIRICINGPRKGVRPVRERHGLCPAGP